MAPLQRAAPTKGRSRSERTSRADQPGEDGGEQHGEHDGDVPDLLAHDRDQGHAEDEDREGLDEVEAARMISELSEAAIVAGEEADRHADDEGDARRR